MKKVLIMIIVFFLFGCGVSAYRGSFQIVSTKKIENGFIALSSTPVEGRACFGASSIITGMPLPDNVIERSIADAISKYPDATYLIDLSFVDEGVCIYTKGIPAKAK